MFKYILIAVISYFLGILTLVIFSVLKISSKCSREEERKNHKFVDYGKEVYDYIERKEKGNDENV